MEFVDNIMPFYHLFFLNRRVIALLSIFRILLRSSSLTDHAHVREVVGAEEVAVVVPDRARYDSNVDYLIYMCLLFYRLGMFMRISRLVTF